MGDYSKTFDWVQFPEGRARFSGGIRGGDERGHETFAVEVNGTPYYGEIDQAFLSDQYNFNIEVISFGYLNKENVANPSPGARQTFISQVLHEVQVLLSQLVRSGLQFERRPIVLRETEKSRFMGRMKFRDGWALEAEKGSVAIPRQSADFGVAP